MTRAIPVWGPRAPIQLIPVPVKLMVACAPGVVESVAIPALHARLVLNGIQSGAPTVPAGEGKGGGVSRQREAVRGGGAAGPHEGKRAAGQAGCLARSFPTPRLVVCGWA